MKTLILFLFISLVLTTGKSFSQKGLSFGLSVGVSKNFLVVNKKESTSTHLKTTTDYVEKIKLNINCDLSNHYFLSFSAGVFRQNYSLKRDKPWISQRDWKEQKRERVLNSFESPNPFGSILLGFRKKISSKTEIHYSAGFESHLLTTYFGPLEKNMTWSGAHYEEGDSTYYERNFNLKAMKKRISLELSMEAGISFISKNYSEFNIFLSYQKGLYKVMTGKNLYYKKTNSALGMQEFYYMFLPPDETYNFFTRDSNLGIGVSYMINWNELKKNKKLEKQYENQKVN